ncbi:MAG TPA: 23S rRNA (adenine(2030)-N(6))-methyltransferase RlmJ [Rhizomicrobium sp.]|nr:23S rRNA (adenine(2030)-N(6))-methyltransferase RlmJ [Rhizomicrobium sp.]
MNYRHSFHAGNFADVAKHLALVSAISHLKKKDKPFVVIDTHGGRGLYDLTSREAKRTAEHGAGIARLAQVQGEGVLGEYLALVRGAEGQYPGSPLIAAKMLRPQDRLVAIEKHPEEFAELRNALRPFTRARAIEGDGYKELVALLPPPERRGLVLIDPPYEDEREFEHAAAAMLAAHRRFATGVYMLWFPIKSPAAADAFCGEIANRGIDKLLRIDIAIKPPPAKPGRGEPMAAAGLLVVNPPFGLDEDVRQAAGFVGPALDARFGTEWLSNS